MKRIAFLSGIALLAITNATVAQTPAVSRGEAVFKHVCAMCHSPNGPATNTLAARLGIERSLLAERRDLAPLYIRYVIRQGLGAMPHLTKIEVPNADADAVAAYLTRNNPK